MWLFLRLPSLVDYKELRKKIHFFVLKKEQITKLIVNRRVRQRITLNTFISWNHHHKALPSSWRHHHGPGLLILYYVVLWHLTILVWQRSIAHLDKNKILAQPRVAFYKALAKFHLLEHKAFQVISQFGSQHILQSFTFCITECTTVHLRRKGALVTTWHNLWNHSISQTHQPWYTFYRCYQLKETLHLRHQCV